MPVIFTGAGFYLQDVGTPHSLGTAGVANVTNTEGADGAWSYPAGMDFVEQDQAFAGLQLVLPRVDFDTNAILFLGGTLRDVF